jgi:PAS domain S-box-containing protein
MIICCGDYWSFWNLPSRKLKLGQKLLKSIEHPDWRSGAAFTFIFIVLVIGLLAIAFFYFRHTEQKYRVKVENELSSIGKLKIESLENYRNERLSDAFTIYRNPAFSVLVKEYFDQPENLIVQNQLRTWVGNIQRADEYDMVMLLDADFTLRLFEPDEKEWPVSFISPGSSESLQKGEIVLEDFYVNEQDQKVYLKVLVPILEETDADRLIGVVGLRIDPELYLYPFISKWPVPSSSAETLLVRRDGNDVLFLNQLRFRDNTALKFREPLSNIELPAAMAVLGKKGIVDGIDYRGVPVIAYVGSVPDSPWFIVARIDKSEVFVPLREQIGIIVTILALLLVSSGTGLGLILRQQRLQSYKEKLISAEHLHESEERFRDFFDNAPIGKSMTAPDGQLHRVNHALCNLLGYSQEELHGMTFASITHPDDLADSVEHVRSIFAGERDSWETDKRYVTRDGRTIWAHVITRLQRDRNNKPLFLMTHVQDITESLRSQKEREVLLSEYEAKNIELERFNYTVSHDLRSPLITIRGFLGMLEDDIIKGDTQQAKSDIQRIDIAATKLMQMLDELLELSRIGRMTNPPVDVSMGDIFADAAELLTANLMTRSIKIIVAPDLPKVHCDRHRLVEAMQNLLDNAVKSLKDQPVPIIEIGYRIENGEPVFFVRDNGIGIDSRYLEKIFGLFDKLDPTTSGTGIGLTITHRIIELHGGKIWAESDGIGLGSTFLFTLPRQGR